MANYMVPKFFLLSALCVAAALSACSVDAASFTPSLCGDGFQAANEQCDDANLIDGDGCDSNCLMTGCGNGIVTAGEQCDDGTKETEPCPYGPTSACVICSATCQAVIGSPLFCGDGMQQSAEACDDGNSTCGACSADCQVRGFNPATGTIHVVEPNLLDGQTFTLKDGVHEVTFEYTHSGTTSDPSFVLIDLRNLPNTGNAVAPPTY